MRILHEKMTHLCWFPTNIYVLHTCVDDVGASRCFVRLKGPVEAKLTGMCEGVDREEKLDAGLRELIGKRG
jgi:hypothetical protein